MEYIQLVGEGGGAISERGMFENAMFRSEDTPRSQDVPLWIVRLLIAKFMLGTLKVHVRDNHKLAKYSRYVT